MALWPRENETPFLDGRGMGFLFNDFFLLYVTNFVDLWNGRGSSSILLSLQRKGGRDDRAEAHHQPIGPQ
jgi:hypothetical protein